MKSKKYKYLLIVAGSAVETRVDTVKFDEVDTIPDFNNLIGSAIDPWSIAAVADKFVVSVYSDQNAAADPNTSKPLEVLEASEILTVNSEDNQFDFSKPYFGVVEYSSGSIGYIELELSEPFSRDLLRAVYTQYSPDEYLVDSFFYKNYVENSVGVLKDEGESRLGIDNSSFMELDIKNKLVISGNLEGE